MSRISRGTFINGPGPPPEAVVASLSKPGLVVIAMGGNIAVSGSIIRRLVEDKMSDILAYEGI